jgi:hypothetical protein
MGLHKNSTDVHVVCAYEYADAATREAATGFAAADVGKFAWQQDDDSIWILTDDSPITWVQVGGAGGADFAPWLVDILPTISERSAAVGTWTFASYNDNTTWPFVGSTGAGAGGTGLQSDGAQNSAVKWKIVLSAGTWDVHIHCRKSSNTGIFTVKIAGASVGTVDSYAASAAYAKVSVTGVSVAADGAQDFELVMATKNVSSSAYYGEIFAISLRRTS